MVVRFNVVGEPDTPFRKRERPKRERRPMTIGRALQAFILVLGFNCGVFLLFYFFNPGAFDVADYSPRGGWNFCAKAFLFLPEAWQSVGACRALNVVPFLIMPVLVLFYLIGRVWRRLLGLT